MVIAALMMARILLIRLTLEAAGFRLSSSTLVTRVQYSQQGYHVFRRERSYLIVCVMSLPSLGCATDGFKGWCLERVLPACRLALQILMVIPGPCVRQVEKASRKEKQSSRECHASSSCSVIILQLNPTSTISPAF